MRKVIFALNISIDGCYEHTSFSPKKELMDYFIQLMQDTGVIVYGRKTYDLMIPYWPEIAKNKTGDPKDVAFAEVMTPIEKIVLSRTLKSAAENTRIVRENPEGLIRELKEQSGKKIAISGTSLLPGLLEAGLIDELYLIVHPVLIGENKRLFDHFLLPEKTDFQLLHTQQFPSGVIALQYQKNG
ncbi:MAG: dihydrofolate reductase family protein [Candidatus Pedobacter colombiensis]|uniref:Dihydrofolate reductase family protein n=1 Tax=Candidatus Pedobacter colombiensis TaxID=3121371 RepID=A0AAJ5W5G1_9SPHI|nr:dihydrofolate reductase family protein [Pedobacter sp.]WEK17930.1 MAG: dihydrofolate reductase family protein [Pedobacter sp.]